MKKKSFKSPYKILEKDETNLNKSDEKNTIMFESTNKTNYINDFPICIKCKKILESKIEKIKKDKYNKYNVDYKIQKVSDLSILAGTTCSSGEEGKINIKIHKTKTSNIILKNNKNKLYPKNVEVSQDFINPEFSIKKENKMDISKTSQIKNPDNLVLNSNDYSDSNRIKIDKKPNSNKIVQESRCDKKQNSFEIFKINNENDIINNKLAELNKNIKNFTYNKSFGNDLNENLIKNNDNNKFNLSNDENKCHNLVTNPNFQINYVDNQKFNLINNNKLDKNKLSTIIPLNKYSDKISSPNYSRTTNKENTSFRSRQVNSLKKSITISSSKKSEKSKKKKNFKIIN